MNAVESVLAYKLTLASEDLDPRVTFDELDRQQLRRPRRPTNPSYRRCLELIRVSLARMATIEALVIALARASQ